MLIHIGYHKTASTWLQKKLFNQDNGFIQPWNLNMVFNHIIRPDSLSYDPQKTRELFFKGMNKHDDKNLVPIISHERLSGDPFTGNRDSKEIALRLKETFPNAKILIAIREQVGLITALYKTYIVLGGKVDLVNFLNPPQREDQCWFDFNAYCYDKLYKFYIELFGVQNVHVVLFEDFKQNNNVFHDVLSNLYDIPKIPLSSKTRIVNPGLSDYSVSMLRKINQIYGLFDYYPINTPRKSWMLTRSMIYRLNHILKKINNDNMKINIERIVGDYYVESNRKLSAMIDVDLSSYGYKS